MAIVGSLAPAPWFTAFDDDGSVISGALLYTYLAGTLTAEPTYTDSDLLIPNTNPIVCDSAGRCVIYLAEKSYKLRLKRPDLSTVRTQDNVGSTSLGQSTSVLDAFTFGGSNDAGSLDLSYPAGATYDKLAPDTGVLSADGNNMSAGFYLQAILRTTDPTTVATLSLFNLTDAPNTVMTGAGAVPITLTSQSTTGELKTSSVPIIFSSGLKQYGVKMLISGGGVGYGFAYSIRLTRA